MIRRAVEGRRDAFGHLYARYRTPIFAHCMKVLGDASLAEDAVQDTFFKAFRCIGSFETGRPVLPWLIAIASRGCIDTQRRRSKVDVHEPHSLTWERFENGDSTADEIIRLEERRELEDALRELPRRQRRALLLFALDGWTYSDIASAEGISIGSTKSLLFRARARLRTTCQGAALGAIFIPLRSLRGRAQRIALRVRAIPGVETAGAPIVQSMAVALTLVATTAFPGPGVSTIVAAGTIPRSPATTKHIAVAATPSRSRPARASAPAATRPSATVVDQAPNEIKRQLDPTANATPEDTRFDSIVPSPRFATDHTMFASGNVPCERALCSVLFRTTDAGTTWTKLAASSYAGSSIMLPPAYPGDGRIFANGPTGLQESDDAGRSFRTIYPLSGSASISPMFDRGDPRILISSSAVLEYWADKGLTKPATLALTPSPRMTVTFSGTSASAPILVGLTRVSESGTGFQSYVSRCVSALCDDAVLPGASEVPSLRLAPDFQRSGLAVAFDSGHVFVSRDAGRSYRALALPAGAGQVTDVAPLASHEIAISFANGEGAPLYVTDARGSSWRASRIDLKGFTLGAGHVISISGRQLFATGAIRGIACSSDEGSTWHRRCL